MLYLGFKANWHFKFYGGAILIYTQIILNYLELLKAHLQKVSYIS